MANETKTGTHHPDVQRDFETGTVNPGPGMAGPIGGKGKDSGTDAGEQRQSPQQQAEQTGRQAAAGDHKKDGSGSCGCG
jgi:hypothetical protein